MQLGIPLSPPCRLTLLSPNNSFPAQLPVLQPHLTGTGGVEGRRRSITGYNPFSNTFKYVAPMHSLSNSNSNRPAKGPRRCMQAHAFGLRDMHACYCAPCSGSRREGMESAPAGLIAGPMEAKSWDSQAKDITADIASSDKYKSLVLHAEVKLAEALERCNRVQPITYASTGEEKPNKLRTAVCCQVSCCEEARCPNLGGGGRGRQG